MRSRRAAFLLSLFTITAGAAAQNAVDITVVPAGENIEVRVRFENDFDGYFAASVFTLRWNAFSGAQLGPLDQDEEVQAYHGVFASGPNEVYNGHRYQVFAGFGGMVLSDIPLTLQAGQWITLCTIPVVNGEDVFSVVNDDYTAEVNGNYFISLGGQESQGQIIDPGMGFDASADMSPTFSVYPSVTFGPLTVEAGLGDANEGFLSVLDVQGEEVRFIPLVGTTGTVRRNIDLSGMAAGPYVVHLNTHGSVRTTRVSKH